MSPLKTIDPSKWRVKLPIYYPEKVMDNSIETAHSSCPTYGFYRYGLRRGFDGLSYPIQYGIAYHKFRELVEKLMIESGLGDGPEALTDEIYKKAAHAAVVNWEEPPVEHRHSHLDLTRLLTAFELTKKRIKEERSSKRIIVTRSEDSVDLEYSWKLCPSCLWTEVKGDKVCSRCSEYTVPIRHGGRIDQFIIFKSLNNARMIRDFKTTSMMGKTYTEKFDPNSQIQGYVWDGTQLSGREFEGALIETIYNTKKEGPIISQHYVTYSRGQQERWEASRMMERQMIELMYSRIEELGYLAFPQRTAHCHAYGGCPFKDACRSGSGYEVEKWLSEYTIESHWDFLSPETEESVV